MSTMPRIRLCRIALLLSALVCLPHSLARKSWAAQRKTRGRHLENLRSPPQSAPPKDVPDDRHFGSPPSVPVPNAGDCTPKTVEVGGKDGWTYGLFTDWKQPQIFVGDSLHFSWDVVTAGEGSGHAVHQFDDEVYFKACDFTGARFLGYNNVTLGPILKPGKLFFGCNTPGHCQGLNQKVPILVLPEPACRNQPKLAPPTTLPAPSSPIVAQDPPCKSKIVSVGGDLGWTLRVNETWKQPAIYAGDSLFFSWDPVAAGEAQHNVFLLRSAAHFANCNFTQSKFVGLNNETVYLRWPGTFYFACNTPGHCSMLGQKASIAVLPESECSTS